MTADPLIDGVRLTELRQIIDERGAVLHHFRCDAPEFTKFGDDLSEFGQQDPVDRRVGGHRVAQARPADRARRV